jgi:UDP-N-acetylglucosamine transferase subunit ALG13
MGSIITALEYGKPIIVMPRRGDLRETRNDHQIATAMRLMKRGGITVALNETELIEKLDQIESPGESERIAAYASADLIGTLRNFVELASRTK